MLCSQIYHELSLLEPLKCDNVFKKWRQDIRRSFEKNLDKDIERMLQIFKKDDKGDEESNRLRITKMECEQTQKTSLKSSNS